MSFGSRDPSCGPPPPSPSPSSESVTTHRSEGHDPAWPRENNTALMSEACVPGRLCQHHGERPEALLKEQASASWAWLRGCPLAIRNIDPLTSKPSGKSCRAYRVEARFAHLLCVVVGGGREGHGGAAAGLNGAEHRQVLTPSVVRRVCGRDNRQRHQGQEIAHPSLVLRDYGRGAPIIPA
jgi:hypothetical protein